MNTLAPSAGPAQRPGESGGLRPPAPTQAAVPPEFASLTWPADIAAVELPAPVGLVPPTPGSFAPPAAQWAAPTSAWDAPSTSSSATAGSGWSWTSIMDDSSSLSRRSTADDLAIDLDALAAVVESQSPATDERVTAARTFVAVEERPPAESRESSDAPPPEAVPTPVAPEGAAMPSVSFDPAAGSVVTAVAERDTAIVTATVPAFVTYAPSADYVLPDAPVREPVAVEVRQAIVHITPTRPVRLRRSGRAAAALLIAAAAVSAAAYLGLREYIYGDTVVADDGTRVVEVEPTRTIVVVDAP